jgi:hypothetical protein
VEGFQSAEQNVLCGVGAAAKHPEGDIQDPWPMTGEQLFEGIAFSGLPPPYQCFIGNGPGGFEERVTHRGAV